MAKTVVSLTISEDVLHQLDEKRGSRARSSYIEDLLIRDGANDSMEVMGRRLRNIDNLLTEMYEDWKARVGKKSKPAPDLTNLGLKSAADFFEEDKLIKDGDFQEDGGKWGS